MKAVSVIDISTNLRKLLNEIAASQEPLLFWAVPGMRESIVEGMREGIDDRASELDW